MLEGYERLTGAAVDYARELCRCFGHVPDGALEGWYREMRRRCFNALYCEDGLEVAGRRCNGSFDCLDGSDEASCE